MQSTVIKSYLFNWYIICIIFHYYPLFFIIFIIIVIILILLQKVVHIWLWHCFDAVEVCFHSFIHLIYLCCVVSFLWGPQTVWFVILHLECSTQNFWGVCVTRWYLGHLKITYYTGDMFDFNVNISYLYLFKTLTIVL